MNRSYDRKASRPDAKHGIAIAACSAILTVACITLDPVTSLAATVTVDTGNIIRDDISAKTFGSGIQHDAAQFNQLMGSQETPNPSGRAMVKSLKLGGMRFPMGTSGQHYYWDHPSWGDPGGVPADWVVTLLQQVVPEPNGPQTYDGIYSYVSEMGMDPLFQVNTFSSIDTSNNLHFVNQNIYGAPVQINAGELEKTSDYAGAWVAAYQAWRSGHPTAPGDQFWEVGNEDWSWWTAPDYARIFGRYAAKMKAQKADIKLLAETLTQPFNPVGSNVPNDATWTTQFAQGLAANGVDLKSVYALSYHQYFSSAVKPMFPANFSFETPDVAGVGTLTACNNDPLLTGSNWTFTGGVTSGGVAAWSAGVAGHGSVWGNPDAPHKAQVAVIQGTSKITSTQSMNLQYGTGYTVTVRAAQRPGNPTNQVVTIKANGSMVGSFTPTGTAFATYSLPFLFSGTGALAVTLSFEGTVDADTTAFIDDVTITDRSFDQYRRAQTQDISSQIFQASELNTLVSKVKAVNNSYNAGWKIWGTEFNQMQDEPTSTIGITDAQDIGQGMVIADWVGRMLEMGVERMDMESLDQHPCFSLIEYGNNGGTPTSPFMSVPGYAYSIYPQKFGTTMVKVSYSGNTLVNGTPQLAAYASLSSDRTKLCMIVVNRDLDNAVPLTVELANGTLSATGATYQELYSANVSDNNSGSAHPIAWTAPAAFSNGQSVHRHSVTYIEMPLTSAVPEPANFSFEFPAFSPGVAASNGVGGSDPRLNPNTATGGDARVGWTFTGGAAWGVAGIATCGSPWGNPPTPGASEAPVPDVTGTQFGVIQHDSAISQSLPWLSSTSYWISVTAAQRPGNAQSVNVKVGSAIVGTLNTANVPSDGKFHNCVLGPFTPTANGNQILALQGLSANDDTMFLDNVRISAVTSGASYRLAPAAAPDKRLNITGTTAGSSVTCALANSGSAQRWLFTRSTGTVFTLAPSSATGLRLNASGTASGSGVCGAASTGSASQKWSLIRVADGFTLTPQNTTACRLNVSGTSTVNVATASPATSLPQVWNLIR